MNKNDINRFFSMNNKDYIVSRNKDFIKWYNEMLDIGYNPSFRLDEIQEIIDKCSRVYIDTYPDNILSDKEIYKELEKSDLFNPYETYSYVFKALRNKSNLFHSLYRLDKIDSNIYYLLDKKDYYKDYRDRCNTNLYYVNVDSSGYIFETNIIDNYDNNNELSIEEMINYINTNHSNIDITPLKRIVFNHDIDLILRDKIIYLTANKLLYSSSIPEVGVERCIKYIDDSKVVLGDINISLKDINNNVLYSKDSKKMIIF